MIKKEDVNKAVIDFCMEVIQEPFLYFSEADLQQLLVEKLRNTDSFIATDVKRSEGQNIHYKTNLIHREYGAKKKERIDIVIFGKSDVLRINTTNLTIKSKNGKQKYLQPAYAFELGTEKTGIHNTQKHFTSDLKKLERCREAGYIIHIITDHTLARTGTKRRDNKEKLINEQFKEVFKTKRPTSNKLKIIAIRLNPLRKNEENWIKCEILDKYKKEDQWEKFYEEDVQDGEKIEELLESQLQ